MKFSIEALVQQNIFSVGVSHDSRIDTYTLILDAHSKSREWALQQFRGLIVSVQRRYQKLTDPSFIARALFILKSLFLGYQDIRNIHFQYLPKQYWCPSSSLIVYSGSDLKFCILLIKQEK